MKRVDAHQHFWDPERGDYGWLRTADQRLQRVFSPDDLQPLLQLTGVERTLLVQAAPTEAETRYLLRLASENAFIAGVVGWVDFAALDVVQRIEALVSDAAGKLKGFRPMIQDIAAPDWILRPELDAAFDALAMRGLVFDALVKPLHLPMLYQRLQRHSALKAVLDHAGKPDIAGAGFDRWAQEVAALAQQTSVYCKLSGLLTEACEGAGEQELDPYVAHVFQCFGKDRVVWGSDWPVSTLRTDYRHWFDMARSLIQRHAPGGEQRVFCDNAARLYGLD